MPLQFVRNVIATAVVGLSFTGMSHAAEIAAISGLYKAEKKKTAGKDAGGKTSIQIGVRYADLLSGNYDWFVEPTLTMRSFDAPDGGTAPSDSTSIKILGGVRWYFPEFSNSITPFLSAAAGVLSDKDANTASNTETERSGLYYFGSGGLRLHINKQFFFDTECTFFESALFATEKTEPTDASADGAASKTETTSNELFVDNRGGIASTTFSVGMKF